MDADSATTRLEMNKAGLCTTMIIKMKATLISAQATGTGNYRLIDFVDKIELIADGHKPIISLEPEQIQAFDFYNNGKLPLDRIRAYSDRGQTMYLYIDFGRYFKDKEYGLDYSKFDSVDLEITTSGSSTTMTNFTADVDNILLEDAPAGQFKGYLKKDLWRKWTTVSDEWQYLSLPTENIIRKIMLQARPPMSSGQFTTSMMNMMHDIELKFKGGSLIPFDQDLATLLRLNALEFGLVRDGGQSYRTSGNPVRSGVGRALRHNATLDNLGGAAITDGWITVEDSNEATPKIWYSQSGSDAGVWHESIGYGLHHTAVFNFDEGTSPDQWLDPELQKPIDLNIHTRSGANYEGGTNYVVLETLVKY